MILIGIPAYGQEPLLQKLVNSLNRYTPQPGVSIIILDDNSPQPLQISSSGIPLEIVRHKKQSGFSKSVNQLMNMAESDYEVLVLLNSDMEVQKNWLAPLLKQLKNKPSAGICGGIEYSYPDKKKVINGGMNPMFSNGAITSLGDLKITGTPEAFRQKKPFLSEWVSFGFAAITRACIKATGMLDERQVNYFSDADYCYRVRMKGFEVWTVPASGVIHRQHQSTKLFYQSGLLKLQADREQFLEKWMPLYATQTKTPKDFVLQTSARAFSGNMRLVPHFVPNAPVKREVDKMLSSNNTLHALYKMVTDPEFNLQDTPADILSSLYTNGMIYFEKSPKPIAKKNLFEGKRVLLISPHPDDIALSVGGTLLCNEYEKSSVKALVVFNASAYNRFGSGNAASNTYLRKFEDIAYFSRLGINVEFLNIEDRLLRHPKKTIYYPEARVEEASVQENFYAHLFKITQGNPDAVFVIPLSAGLMSDHFIVTSSFVKLIKTGAINKNQLIFYEDIPYVTLPGALAKTMRYFDTENIALAPVYSDVSAVFEKKLENLSVYFSQIDAPMITRADEYAFALTTEQPEQTDYATRFERLWKIV